MVRRLELCARACALLVSRSDHQVKTFLGEVANPICAQANLSRQTGFDKFGTAQAGNLSVPVKYDAFRQSG